MQECGIDGSIFCFELCFLSCWVCSERHFSRSVMNVRWNQTCVQRSPTQHQSRALAASREAAGSMHRSPQSPTQETKKASALGQELDHKQ